MIKKCFSLLILGIGCILSSCRANTPDAESTNQVITTQADTASIISSSDEGADIPSSERADTSYEDASEPADRIIWALQLLPALSEDAQEEVKRFIKEKGIECRIDFVVPPVMGRGYIEWLAKQKELGQAPDILNSSFWEHGQMDVPSFVRTQYIPLNDFLSSPDGALLYNAYSEVEWQQAEVNGFIYSVPRRLANNTGEVYLYINNRFAELYDTLFDGTYASLRKIYSEVSSPDSIIAFESFNTSIILALMGMHEIYPVAYDMKTDYVPALTRQDSTKAFFELLYSDLQGGVLVNDVSPDSVPSNTVFYICKNRVNALEGFSERLLCPAVFQSDPSGVGVSKDSKNQTLALEVLSACYSDPKIASLLCWEEEDPFRWETMTADLNGYKVSSITGFIPELTEDEHDILVKYYNDFGSLINYLFISRGNDTYVNPDYSDYLNQFFENSREYGDVFEKINEQLMHWKTKE